MIGSRVRRSGGRAVSRGGVVLMLLTAGPPVAAAQNATAILDRAVQAYAQVRTLRADFVQLVRDPMLGDTATSRGEFLQQRPDKFAMRWTQPRGDVIVADGDTLWLYLPSSAPNQVVRASASGGEGPGVDLVAEFLERPQAKFTVAYERADSVGARAADVLALTPRNRNAPYRKVLVWVDRQDALLRRVEITEATGAVRRVTFDRLRVNTTIPAALFTFRPPRGARVVDASP